jgi:TRAP-type uncharacterized transport system substrate-binding protein
MLRGLVMLAPALVAGISFASTRYAVAEDVKLPATLTFTAYDTGTAGFNIAVGVGKMMKDKFGTDVRVLPAGNDVARLAPLRAKRAASSAMGSGTYFAQEGVFEFGAKEWGPQPLQIMLSTVDCNCGSLGVAADVGVKDLKDLKGKRVGFVVGSPALNQNSLAVLAFAGLTQKDVKVVEFASYGAMWKGLVRPPLPAGDKEGWARMHKVGSFFFSQLATCGAGITPEKPIELGNYPYPIFVAYASQPADQVYAMTKAMIVNYDAYKDSAPGAGGLAADRQTKNWVVPVHPGAVKALKEAGQWSDAQEAHNNNLIRRQEVLAAAWTDYGKSNPPADDKAFLDGWMKARAAALAKANMPNGFED